MSASLSELTEPQSKDDVLTLLLAFLSAQGFPVTTWAEGSVGRDLVEWCARFLSDTTFLHALIARGAYLDTAEGDWLTLLAASQYQKVRNPAVKAVQVFVMTDPPGSPIYDSGFSAQAATGIVFTSTTVATASAGGTHTTTITADVAGVTGNVSADTITELITSYPGLTVSNPINVFTGSSIVTSGTDEQTDQALRTECKDQWGVLDGIIVEAYGQWARETVTTITRVKVYGASESSGNVSVLIASATGPASLTAYLAAVDYIADRKPLCVAANVLNCTANTIAPLGTVYYRNASQLTNAQSQVEGNLLELSLAKGIGDPVYLAEIIEQIMRADDVVNVALTDPTTDTSLTYYQVPVITGVLLDFVEVP